MLTYDDLDHFDERTMAGLFGLADAEAKANALKRRERILACLRFCRDIPEEELGEAGLLTARRLIKRALRTGLRDCPQRAESLESLLAGALLALGDPPLPAYEAAEVAALRHAVEREIEAAARARVDTDTDAPFLLEILRRGDFAIGPASDLASLDEAIGKFGGNAEVDLELILDGDDHPAGVHVRLGVACGFWRWSAPNGCSLAFADGNSLALPAYDALIPVLLAGLSVQSGRAITLWAKAVKGQRLN